MNIAVGNILEWLPPDSSDEDQNPASGFNLLLERVLWKESSIVVSIYMQGPQKCSQANGMPVIRLVAEIERALEEQRLCINRVDDPYAWVLTLPVEYTEKHGKHQERAWNAIKDIVKQEPGIYDPKTRGCLVRRAARQHKVSRPFIFKQMCRYWKAGKIAEALYPDFFRCGHIPQGQEFKHSKTPIDTKIKIIDGIKKFKTGSKKFKELQVDIVEKYFSYDDPYTGRRIAYEKVPSVEDIKYYNDRLKREDLKSCIIRELGIGKYSKDFRPLLNTSQSYVLSPADTYQIDHTVADIYLVSKYDRALIIGRPMVYLVKDVFSRMVVGIYVGLEGPSWEGGASQALLNAFSPKLPFLQELGMDSLFWDVLKVKVDEMTWPADCIPGRVLGDWEVVKEKADAPIMPLGLTISNTPSRRPWAKGIIESQFRVSTDYYLNWAPGAVSEYVKEVKRRDYKYDARFTVEDFTKILLLHIFLWNSHFMPNYKRDKGMIRDHVNPVPRELWEWGWLNRGGLPHQRSREVIELALLPRKKGRMTQSGLEFKKRTYIPQVPEARELFEKAAYFGTYEVVVSYDSRSSEQILWHDVENQRVVPCLLNVPKEARYLGFSDEDIDVLHDADKKALKEDDRRELQMQLDCRQCAKRITEEAETAQKNALEGRKLTKKTRGDVAKNRASVIRARADEKQGEIFGQKVEPPAPEFEEDEVESVDDVIFDLLHRKEKDHEKDRRV